MSNHVSNVKRRLLHLAVVSRIKLERGCIDCGFKGDPVALHFDHRDQALKSFSISRSISRSLKNLLAEIEKCDVRCANCHASRTKREGHHSFRPTK